MKFKPKAQNKAQNFNFSSITIAKLYFKKLQNNKTHQLLNVVICLKYIRRKHKITFEGIRKQQAQNEAQNIFKHCAQD